MFLITKENLLELMNFLFLAWSGHAGLPGPFLTNIVFISAFNFACMFYNSYYLLARWFTLLAPGYLTKTLLCPDHTLVTIYCLVVATKVQQPINILLQDLVIRTLFLMSFNSFLLFSSGYDFAYLLKVLTAQNLPSEESEFFDLLKLYFPNIYDVKYLMKSCKSLKGGLQEVAELLEVRIQINKSFDESRQMPILLIII